jgi:hypothetical protein
MTLFASGSDLPLVLVILLMAAKTVQGRLAHAAQILVAKRALERRYRMGVSQGKLGSIMVEAAGGAFPVVLPMTIGTFFTQGPIVLVVFLVARIAVLGSLFEHGALVATFAFHFGVLAQQGKTAPVMVKLGRFFPAALTVTTGTVFTQGLLVFVIFCMAGMAILAQLDPVKVAGVATGAGRCAVLAAQDILGIDVVVEVDCFPYIHTMTGLTFFTEKTFVALGAVILFFVAADAGTRCLLVVGSFVLVTANALGFCVLAGQCKARCTMVKLGLFPVHLVVTISTFGSQ